VPAETQHNACNHAASARVSGQASRLLQTYGGAYGCSGCGTCVLHKPSSFDPKSGDQGDSHCLSYRVNLCMLLYYRKCMLQHSAAGCARIVRCRERERDDGYTAPVGQRQCPIFQFNSPQILSRGLTQCLLTGLAPCHDDRLL